MLNISLVSLSNQLLFGYKLSKLWSLLKILKIKIAYHLLK
jgi:hypothetical protein